MDARIGYNKNLRIRTNNGIKELQHLTDADLVYDAFNNLQPVRIGQAFRASCLLVQNKAFGRSEQGVNVYEQMVVTENVKLECIAGGVEPSISNDDKRNPRKLQWYTLCPVDVNYDAAVRSALLLRRPEVPQEELDGLLADMRPADVPREDRRARQEPGPSTQRRLILPGLSSDLPSNPSSDQPLPTSSDPARPVAKRQRTLQSRYNLRSSSQPTSSEFMPSSDSVLNEMAMNPILQQRLTSILSDLRNKVCHCGIFRHANRLIDTIEDAQTAKSLLESDLDFNKVDPLRVWDGDHLLMDSTAFVHAKHKTEGARLKLWTSPRWLEETQRGVQQGPMQATQLAAHELPVHPRYLGLWLGDGAQNASTIFTSDQEIADWLQEHANFLNRYLRPADQPPMECKQLVNTKAGSVRILDGKEITTQRDVWSIAFQGAWNPVRSGLRTLGLLGHKGAGLSEQYMNGTTATKLAVLGGLIDSDGCNHRDGYEFVQFTEPHKRIVEDWRDLANSVRVQGLTLNASFVRTNEVMNRGARRIGYKSLITGPALSLLRPFVLVPRKKDAFQRHRDMDVYDRHGFTVAALAEADWVDLVPIAVNGHVFQRHDRCILYDSQPSGSE